MKSVDQYTGLVEWLPGLVSESAILWDLTALTWRRPRHGRIILAST